MNYKTDTTRLSVLVVAFLLVGSAFAFLPAFASTGGVRTTTVNPAQTNNASPPTLAGAPYVIVGTGVSPGTTFGVNVTNPASNAFAITSITIIAPGASSGFSFTDSGATCGTANVLLGTVGATSTNAIQCTAGTGTGLPPGFSQVITLGGLIGPVVAASAAPSIGTFTSLVVDSSGTGESYSGSSFNVYSIAPDISIAVTLSNSPATTFTAGSSAITVTATLGSGQVGVPLVFAFSAGSSYPASGFTSTIAPSSTLSSGTTTTTSWTPSNHAGDATGVKVTLGNSAITATSSTSLTTIAGAPSEVSFYFTNTGTTYSSDYLTNPVTVAGTGYATTGTTTISLSLADAYANAVTFSSSITAMTVSASGGEFLLATPQTLEASFSCLTGAGNIVCPTSGTSLIFGTNVNSRSDGAITYVQSSLYGATGTLSASITTASATYTGTSGNVITSALDSTLASPKILNSTQATAQGSGTVFVEAGTSLSVYESLTSPVQQGVPITLNFCAACAGTSTGYNTALSGFVGSETLYTNSTGMVEEALPVNITVGATAVFNATMTAPTTTSTTNTIASSGLSLVAQTTVGAISTLVINVAANAPSATGKDVTYLANGATAYVDVAYADSYGNLIPIGDAPTSEVQIALSATSGGLLSATNVYINSGQVSTNGTGSIGSIQLTLPDTLGTTITLTATGVVSGKSVVGTTTVTTVSDSPIVNVTSPVPVNGTLYTDSLETIFKGTANASIGLPANDIATIGYQVGTGQWLQVSTAQLHNVSWSIPIILSAGLNTVTFNATDNESPAVTTVSAPFTVLVDTSAPTFSSLAVGNNGSTVNFNVTSAEGDLNWSSVTAWANGTALPSSEISVSGANDLGSSVTYAVTISPSQAGTWALIVNATTLAGKTGTTSGTVTTTSTSSPTSPNAITFPSSASYQLFGNTYHSVAVPVTNTGTGTVTAVVFAVAHNAEGQTVEVSTATVQVSAAGTQTAYVILNLPSGTYTVNVFVWSISGTSISAEQSSVAITF